MFFYQTYTDGGPGANWQQWTPGLIPTPGQYYLGWEVETDSDTSGQYGIEILPVALKAPANPTWSAGTASWDAVTTDKNGNTLKAGDVTGYEVALYKGGGTDAVATATVGSSATTYDFKEKLSESGAGAYTYTVRALASTDASA